MRRSNGWLSILVVQFALVSPAMAGGVAIVSTTLSDNGDNDGFADTDETVTVHVTVRNTSAVALSDVSLSLYTTEPTVGCLSVPTIAVGDLAVGQTQPVPDGFVFTIGALDRTALGLGPLDPLVLTFDVGVSSSPGGQRAFPGKLSFDLDLDVAGGSGNTTFFEGFENALGQFSVQNLDDGLSSPAASDGYRCQYNDPDDPSSNSFNDSHCFLGASPAHAAQVWWGQSGPETSPGGGRGFSGFHSLFFGFDLGPPENWTTPVGILEAAAMTAPVGLSATTPATLTFKHQASFADSRAFSLAPRESYDRGVVMVQVADAAGNPVGPWYKVDPWQNGYDQQNAPFITNCTYDPTDDGSTEDSYYSPTHPDRRYGSSSTCYPEWAFVRIGETSNPFAAGNVGYAEGPGLQGLWGPGTWIESKVDLSRFRGRRIRVRFLAAAVSAYTFETWEHLFQFNPDPGDDGWWIDDVQIDNLVTTPATVTVDAKNNSALPDVPGDGDSDGVPDVCDNCTVLANATQYDEDHDGLGDDCDPCRLNADNFDPDLDQVCGDDDNCPFVANASQADGDSDGSGAACDCNDSASSVHPGADEINDGLDNDCTGEVDEISGTSGFFEAGGSKTLFSWPAQSGATAYQVVRSDQPDFPADCVFATSATASYSVTFVPPAGQVAYLLVRSLQPLRGSWGADSSGVSRTPCS